MTDGTSQGLFIVVAIVIFGVFVVLAYILFEDTLSPAMASMFNDSTNMVAKNINIAKYYDEYVIPNAESDFIFDKNTGMITEYIGQSKDVVIPYEIDSVIVTSLGKESFTNKGLDSVVLPNTITKLEDSVHWSSPDTKGVFKGNNLKTVSIPKSVTHIGVGAFADNDLETIKLSRGLVTIAMDAFRNNKIKGVTIPNTVTYIGADAFEINRLTELTVPSSVKELGYCSFNLNRIEKLTLHEGLEKIGDSSFGGSKMTTVTFPKSLKVIGGHAFSFVPLDTVYIHRHTTYDKGSSSPTFQSAVKIIVVD